ncbi:hypothetical protein BLNAU_8723 [Blattamonas nauphoetae]|uniref:IPT/TIG domain-containing protein n=1 Tax=Blattamonas nauphoetae TaxID=2049346 RepID=A0ABQ9XXY3_9EUKA|nr:hypothetical protein BLNAU_8723 [Blattamonas nauphoetae]
MRVRQQRRYKVFLHDRSSFEVDFSFTSGGFLIGSHHLDGVGDRTKWKEGSVWVVTGMESVSDPSIDVLVEKTLFFPIPVLPSHVARIDSPLLNKKKTEVSFEIVGSEFPSSITSVSLKRGERTITASKTITVPSDTSILIPSPPTITSITTGPSSSPNEFVLKMEGTNLPSTEVFLAQIDSFPTIRVRMSGDGTTGESDTIRAGQSHIIQFNTSYTVKTLRKEGDEDEHILLSSSTFTTPVGPILTTISCHLSTSNANFVVLTVGGDQLADGQYYQVLQKVSDQPITIEIPITSNAGAVHLLTFGSGVLEYSGKYVVKRMWSESVEVVVDPAASSFAVDSAPARIESALCVLSVESEANVELSTLAESEMKEAKLTLSGSHLPLDKAITIQVKPFSSDGQILDTPITFASLSAETASTIIIKVDMYESGPKLEFGTKYEVASLVITGTPSVLTPKIQFSVPIESVRVKAVSVDETPTTIKVKISGSGFFAAETYQMKVFGTPSNGGTGATHSQTITVVTSDATHAVSSSIVLGTDESAVLRFGYSYTINSITNGTEEGFVEGTHTFETTSLSPSQPQILSASVETNGQKTRMRIVLSGSNLLQDSHFTLKLNGKLQLGGTDQKGL